MDEVRDVGPEHLVAVAEGDGRAQAFGLHLEPDLAEPLGGQLARLALRRERLRSNW